MLVLAICVIGLLVYVLSPVSSQNPRMVRVTEVGRIMFWVGLLVWLLGGHAVPNIAVH